MHTFKIMKDGNRFWVPSRSYFKIKIAMMRYGLDQKDGIRATAESNRPVLLGDTIAPILNFPSAMFKNVRFFIGPDKVSDVSTNLALISTARIGSQNLALGFPHLVYLRRGSGSCGKT